MATYANTRYWAVAIAFAILCVMLALPAVSARDHQDKQHERHAAHKLSALKQRVRLGAGTTYSGTWETGTWSECSATCGAGHKTRTVTCVDSADAVIDDSFCDPDTQPIQSKVCNLGECFSWTHTSWSDCSASCGSGHRTRTVTCVDLEGTVVDDSFCATADEPIRSESCEIAECEVWTWVLGSWSECTATCGGGTKTRSGFCYDQNGVLSSDPAVDCGESPTLSRTCDTQACEESCSSTGTSESSESSSESKSESESSTDTTSSATDSAESDQSATADLLTLTGTTSTGTVIETSTGVVESTSTGESDQYSSTATTSEETLDDEDEDDDDNSAAARAPAFIVTAVAATAVAMLF